MKAQEIYTLIDSRIAPFSFAEQWDNSGFLVGSPQAEVDTVLVCLDITLSVIEQAKRVGAQLIVSHHPVIFHPLKRVMAGSPAYALVQAGLCAICAHTNLDLARGGVNDCLAQALGLENIRPLGGFSADAGTPSLGRVGELQRPLPADEFAALVSRALHPAGGVRYTDGGRPVCRVAVCGGAGSSLWRELPPDIDALLTGEVEHDVFIDAQMAGLTVADAGHYDTECVVLAPLCERLARLAPQVKFIRAQQESPVRCVYEPFI